MCRAARRRLLPERVDRVPAVDRGARRAAVRRAAHAFASTSSFSTSGVSGSTTKKRRCVSAINSSITRSASATSCTNLNSGDQASFALVVRRAELSRPHRPIAADRRRACSTRSRLRHAAARRARRRAVSGTAAAARVLAPRLVARRAIGIDGRCKTTEGARSSRCSQYSEYCCGSSLCCSSRRSPRTPTTSLGWQNWILLINSVGIGVLLVLIVVNLCAARSATTGGTCRARGCARAW